MKIEVVSAHSQGRDSYDILTKPVSSRNGK